MLVKKQQLELDMVQQTGSKLGDEYKSVYCQTVYLTHMQSFCNLVHGFPGSSASKESTCNAGDPGSIPGSGRSPGEGIS